MPERGRRPLWPAVPCDCSGSSFHTAVWGANSFRLVALTSHRTPAGSSFNHPAEKMVKPELLGTNDAQTPLVTARNVNSSGSEQDSTAPGHSHLRGPPDTRKRDDSTEGEVTSAIARWRPDTRLSFEPPQTPATCIQLNRRLPPTGCRRASGSGDLGTQRQHLPLLQQAAWPALSWPLGPLPGENPHPSVARLRSWGSSCWCHPLPAHADLGVDAPRPYNLAFAPFPKQRLGGSGRARPICVSPFVSPSAEARALRHTGPHSCHGPCLQGGLCLLLPQTPLILWLCPPPGPCARPRERDDHSRYPSQATIDAHTFHSRPSGQKWSLGPP